MSNSLKYKIQYSFQQAAYWGAFCAASAFAMVYLQSLGLSNSMCGIIFALGFTGGFIIGPLLADAIDSQSRVTVWGVILSLLGVQAVALTAVVLIGRGSPLLGVCYGIFIALNICGNGFITQVSVDFAEAGVDVSYGTARAMGSLAYVVMSVIIGAAVTRFSESVIPLFSLACIVLQALAALVLRSSRKKLAAVSPAGRSKEKAKPLPAFIAANPRFCLVLAGICIIFFTHNTMNNFLINVVTNVGGNTQIMGNITAFVAFVEIPVIFFYPFVLKKYDSAKLLAIAAFFFGLKGILVALAGSVTSLVLAMSLQMFSFALYAPVIVDYVNASIPVQDSAKGQSLAYSMVTLASIFSSVFAGRLYDVVGVSSTLMISGIIGLAGTALCMAGCLIKKKA